MRRSHLNFLVDAVAFAMFLFMVATGVIMEFLLPSGGGHSTTIWGLDRHVWGDVHFWMAVVFLTALAVHVYLHWNWIVSVLRGRPREGSGTRVGLGVFGLVALLAIAAAPLLSPVERSVVSRDFAEPRWGLSAEAEALQGSTTLDEVVSTTGVTLDYLISELGLPADVSPDDHLGLLARENGFSVADVREVVGLGLDVGDQWAARGAGVSSTPTLPSEHIVGDRYETAAEMLLVEEEEHAEDHEDRLAGLSDIRGSTTIGEVVDLGVPLETLCWELKFPAGTPLSESLGRLGRTYGFTLSQVRELVETIR